MGGWGERLKNMYSRMKLTFSFSSINLSFNTSSLRCAIVTDGILTSCHELSAVVLADVTTAMRSRQTAGTAAVKRSDTYSAKDSQDIVS